MHRGRTPREEKEMRRIERTLLCLAVTMAGLPAVARAELELPRESPPARLSQQVGLTDISVEYVSPAVRGRKIWGGVVPYGQPWAFGGRQAPRVRFGRDVTIGDRVVPAGTYALYAIPDKTDWTLVLDKSADQFTAAAAVTAASATAGAGRDHRAELEVARVSVRPKAAQPRERLTFLFASFTDDAAALEFQWDRLEVVLPIGVNTSRQVAVDLIGLDTTWRSYANAARYMLETKKDYVAGLYYIDQSLALKQDWYNVWIKALLCAGKGDYKAATKEAQLAYDLGQKSSDTAFPEAEIKRTLADWGQKSLAAR
jgi:Protein of unknown function (DUF2911)